MGSVPDPNRLHGCRDVFEDNMVEAKAMPQNFVLEVSSRLRPVLEDPIPAWLFL